MNPLIMGEDKKYQMYYVIEYQYFYLTSVLKLVYCTPFLMQYELMSTKM